MNIPEQAVETVAKFMSETATDWTDIEINDHEHDLECTNWEAYTDDAQAALEAALPCLEAALRTQIADELKAKGDTYPAHSERRGAWHSASRIAAGD